MFMKIVKIVLVLALAVLVILQFFQPDANTAREGHADFFLAETNPPKDVRAILTSSCFDCHSDHTVYPWYNKIAPVSYWLDGHIDHGKGSLNFSEWLSYSQGKREHKMEEIAEEVGKAHMPLEEYTWTHREARLTEAQRKAVMEWANQTRLLYQLGNQPK